MLCENCKTDLVENSTYCHVCGKKVKATGKKYSITNRYTVVMITLYGIAILICFICNLAASHRLSWFYIVLVSILIAFSITNLPLVLKRHKSVITAVTITLLTYLLLFACHANWVAYTIAAFAFVFAWLIFAIIKYLKANWGYKIALILLLSGIATITSNPFITGLMGGEYKIADSFIYDGGMVNYSANGIVFLCLVAGAVISVIVGIIRSIVLSKRRDAYESSSNQNRI